jgi:ketosteroid isomerase-like protein
MPASGARLVVADAFASWAAGDLRGLRSVLAEDLVFSVYSRPEAPSVVGEGLGRTQFLRRLERLLDHVDVLAFDPVNITSDGLWHHARVRFRYRHLANRIVIDGTMRHRFGFVGSRISHFELFHDTHRMRAFYDMGRLPAWST